MSFIFKTPVNSSNYGKNRNQLHLANTDLPHLKQECPPAWPQEAYRPWCSLSGWGGGVFGGSPMAGGTPVISGLLNLRLLLYQMIWLSTSSTFWISSHSSRMTYHKLVLVTTSLTSSMLTFTSHRWWTANKLKALPSRRTAYAGGKYVIPICMAVRCVIWSYSLWWVKRVIVTDRVSSTRGGYIFTLCVCPHPGGVGVPGPGLDGGRGGYPVQVWMGGTLSSWWWGGTLAGGVPQQEGYPGGGVPWWGVPWRGVPWWGVPRWGGYPMEGYPSGGGGVDLLCRGRYASCVLTQEDFLV